jgi:serine/threonine protein kinase
MTTSSHVEDAAPSGYRILFELGRGGMGAAFLARAEGVGGFERLVVIKRIRAERADAHSVERFLREARIAAAIHHANVVSAQNVGEDADGPFIVLDYIDGASLEELLDRSALKQQPIPVAVMLRIAVDTLAGLEAVHQAHDGHGKRLNALHRDVSLQNILVGVDGVSRLLDFGIARSDLGGVTTDQRYLVGKLPYLSPEYLRREALTPSADVYSLGVTLWLALTGKELWEKASEAQVLRYILQEGIPPLSRELQVAPEIVELVARACAADREARFRTAREMAAQIELLGRERGWLATHHEVSEWLAELLGADLARRRERIAALANEPVLPRVRGTTSGTLKSAAHRLNAEQQPNSPQPSAEQASASQRASVSARPRWTAVVVLGIAASVLAAGIWAWQRGGGEAKPTTPQPSVSAAEPVVASVAPLADEPHAPSASVEHSPPAMPAHRSAAVPTNRSAQREPSATSAKPAASPPDKQTARPPDQISKHNPYRE